MLRDRMITYREQIITWLGKNALADFRVLYVVCVQTEMKHNQAGNVPDYGHYHGNMQAKTI